ncbi:MAG: hypothetical protein P8164_12085 [Gammaproteobacteria bacterium]
MDSAKGFVTGCLSLCCFVVLAVLSHAAQAAGFSTNFQPTQPDGLWTNQQGYCSFASTGCDSLNQWGNGDPSPFEISIVTVGGVAYFHTLVGDPASGFAIESYTQWGPGSSTSGTTAITKAQSSPSGGGNSRLVIGNDNMTASFLQNQMQVGNPFGNPNLPNPTNDPLLSAKVSGNGSQTPTATVFRMVLTSADGTMSMEAYKPFLDKKPMISQTIQDGSMSSVFAADMRGVGYNDMNSPIKITNNLTINDPKIPGGEGNFEMALAQQPDVTAGRYTFDATGVGWNTTTGWDSPDSVYTFGHYNYIDGVGFDPLTFNWASVFDYNQNALNCQRVNTGPGVSRMTMNGGAGCPGHP